MPAQSMFAGSTAVATGSVIIAAVLLLRERRLRRQLADETSRLQEEASRAIRLREEERRGRIRAEQRLRALANSSAASGFGGDVENVTGAEDVSSAAHGDANGDCSANDAHLPGSDDGFIFRPIGVFSSCYRSRCGTPRQGGVVADCLSVLKCSRDLNPAAALEGFEEFSHCWVLYVFHENTNLPREGRTVANRRGQKKGRIPLWQGLCMKVAPPRCPDKDLRVGVLSCRTPHRPNPIGLSLARVVRVDKKAGELTLAGLDVVDGTPCLDLKPYLPQYESVPQAAVPRWVQNSYEEPLMQVAWTSAALASFSRMLARGPDDEEDGDDGDAASAGPRISVRPFRSRVALRSALEGTLALDIRSPLQRERHPNPGYAREGNEQQPFFVGDLWFHELHVFYALLPVEPAISGAASASVRIERIEPRPTASD